MSFHGRNIAAAVVIAVLAAPVSQAHAEPVHPTTVDAACAGPSTTDGAGRDTASVDRHALLVSDPELHHLVEALGAGAMYDAGLNIMAQGMSDEAVRLLVDSEPLYPDGPPIPTYPPPLPVHAADLPPGPGSGSSPSARVLGVDCGRQLAAMAVYSWWATGICTMFGIGGGIFVGWLCGAIAWGIDKMVPWEDVCRMETTPATRHRAHAGDQGLPRSRDFRTAVHQAIDD